MIEFRRAALSDTDTLASLRLAFLSETYSTDLAHSHPAFPAALRDWFSRHLGGQEFVAWLAEDDGRVVGTSGLMLWNCPPLPDNPSGRRGYIMNMYTLPSHRRRGIASGLLQRLLNECRTRSIRKVALHAEPGARPLYEAAGFEAADDYMSLTL